MGALADITAVTASVVFGAAFLPLGILVGGVFAVGSLINSVSWNRETSARKVE